MERKTIKELAYAMERAYAVTTTLGDATHYVADQFDGIEIPEGVLSGMWWAINAYVDVNEQREE